MFAGPDLSPNGKIIYACVTYALMMVSYTVINVPYSARCSGSSARRRAPAPSRPRFGFVGAFGAAFLISLFVRPLVKYLGGRQRAAGLSMTMAIFAVVSVVLILITFATTKERVVASDRSRKPTSARSWASSSRTGRGSCCSSPPIFSNAFSALRSGSTIFYFKYVQGFDSTPVFWRPGSHHPVPDQRRAGLWLLGTVCLGPIARRVDKKYFAAGLSLVTGLCFLAFYFMPRGQFGLMIAVNMLAQFCAGPTSALTWALYGDVADYGECEVRAALHWPDLLGLSFLDQVGHPHRRLPRPAVPGAVWLCQRRGNADRPCRCWASPSPSRSGPRFFALLKAIALWIYPLNQKRVDEIERELAARRLANPQAIPA